MARLPIRNWAEWERQERLRYYKAHRPDTMTDEALARLVAECNAHIETEKARLEKEQGYEPS